MTVPELPALLAYLRWLDRMESWNSRQFPNALSQLTQRKRDKELYSWSGDFGNPIALPQIKKYKDSEKYRSVQIAKLAFSDTGMLKKRIAKVKNSKLAAISDNNNNVKESQTTLADYYTVKCWLPPSEKPLIKPKAQSAPVAQHSKGKRNDSSFYKNAKSGFRYWPEDLHRTVEHPTRYSFGDRFNPGRAGVVIDRIYAKPRSNFHYWSEYQQQQRPIGSGNFHSDMKLRSRLFK